mmetsp:Transcript_137347/g.238879  ORF Transcript_137347/g.238879 Transcript_137347/m.238879 type:complete len:138 (-) Transcript_137347:54-467(-)
MARGAAAAVEWSCCKHGHIRHYTNTVTHTHAHSLFTPNLNSTPTTVPHALASSLSTHASNIFNPNADPTPFTDAFTNTDIDTITLALINTNINIFDPTHVSLSNLNTISARDAISVPHTHTRGHSRSITDSPPETKP